MQSNFSILIFFALFILVYLILRGSKMHDGIRLSLLKSVISFSYIVFFTNEVLGMTSILYTSYLFGIYVSLITMAILTLRKLAIPGIQILKSDIQTIWQASKLYFVGSLRYLFLFFLVVTLFLSIYIAPNNTDALGYHIARVMFWAQNHNLYHFPTQFSPQLYYNVMSEYFFLQLYLLTGSDYFFNCVQWGAMLVCLLAVSSMLKSWGASKHLQGLGAILTLTIPQVLLQSTSSQNDLLSASYFIVSLYFGYEIIKVKFTKSAYFWGVSALIIGGFTKYSVFILGLPVIIYFALYQIRVKFSRALYMGIISIMVFLLMFANFFYRNFQLMGEMIAPDSSSPLYIGDYTSQLFTWKSLVSNLLKIAGNHLALPLSSWNSLYDKFVLYVHEGINFPMNSNLTSLNSYSTAFTIGEDFSGNFIHFVCLLIALIFIIFRPSTWKLPQVSLLLLLVIGLLFYAEIFKWQRFHARTQMSFFVAMTPILIYLWNHIKSLTEKQIRLISFLFLLQGLPFLLFNSIKPIVPISYGLKRFIHYLPASISAEQTNEVLGNKLVDLRIYTLGPDNRLLKSSDLTFKESGIGFDLLDKLGTFQQDKLWIGSHSERFSHYVLFNHARYGELEGIFRALGPHRKHVGFQSNSSFVSPFFFMGKALIGQDFQMKYIQYPSLFLGHCNAQERFQYDAILSDNPTFIAKIPTHLGKVIRFKTWTLVLLKRPSSHVFVER